jgi:hypothetical protein
MENLKMFDYTADMKEINKLRDEMSFTYLLDYDESLQLALASNISFEKWAMGKFGFNYNKNSLAIAICLELINLFND